MERLGYDAWMTASDHSRNGRGRPRSAGSPLLGGRGVFSTCRKQRFAHREHRYMSLPTSRNTKAVPSRRANRYILPSLVETNSSLAKQCTIRQPRRAETVDAPVAAVRSPSSWGHIFSPAPLAPPLRGSRWTEKYERGRQPRAAAQETAPT